MRLTEDERRVADDVARHWAYTCRTLEESWARALAFITARRQALGDAEPAPATDGGEEMLPDGVLATLGLLHRAALRVYEHHTHRWSCDTLTPAEQAEAWAALGDALHLPPGTATAAGVGGDEPRAEAVGDSAGPANQSPPTTARDCSAAHWCRLNGWGVGTILEGDEGRGPERIVITAVGEEDILAKRIGVPDSERSWVLWCRDWKRVGWHGQYSTVHDGQGADGTGVPLTARIWGRRETAAGVGAEDDDEKPVAWAVVMPTGQTCYVTMRRDDAVDTARGEDEVVPLYRRGTPRGVVVTDDQRAAIATAMRLGIEGGPLWTHAPSLCDLLVAIDAAKGGTA